MSKKNRKVSTKKKSTSLRADLLKVSKSNKIMATFASLRGFSKRQAICIMGEAEQNYKKNGRLIFGG